ncbi:MAG: BatD family protein [Flavobacteriaceae bacterium]
MIRSKNMLIVFLSVAFSSWAQVNFEVKVSKNKLGLNERLRVDFSIDKAGDNFRPPAFSNFRVISGPMQSVSNVFVNGKRSYSMSYSYFLAPLKKGVYDIEQAQIEFEGKTFKTTPVTVTVTDAVEVPRDPNDPSYVVDEKLHLVAEISNKRPYVNEPVTVIYKLYFAQNLMPTNVNVVDNPTYNDFWSYNVDLQRRDIQTTVFKGERYNYVEWRKTVLYPQRSGTLDIEPLTLDVTVDVPTGRRDFFRNMIYKQVPKLISAGDVKIDVLPLPEQGRPADFSGAVGAFDFDVTSSKTQLKASESLQAVVTISGKGNLKLFSLPELQTPSALEQYEPEQQEKVRTASAGMSGSVSESYTLVPQFQGKYPIPPLRFSYFDPKAKSYKTLNSKEIVIDVTEGPTASNASDPTQNTNRISLPDSQFQFIRINTKFSPVKATEFLGSSLFYTLLALPVLLLAIFWLFLRKQQRANADFEGVRMRTANRMARKYLSEAKRNLDNSEAFYVALERALHNYLKAKLHMETADFSKEKIANILTQIGIENDLVEAFVGVLENCEFARYTPSSVGAMRSDYTHTAKLISQIDKQF